MSQNPNAQGAEQEETEVMIAAGFGLAAIIGAYIFLQEHFSAFAGAISYLHVYPYARLVEYFPQLRDLPFIGSYFFARVELAKLFLDQGNFAYMDSAQRRDVLSAAGLCALPFYLPFMIYAGVRGRHFRPDLSYQKNYTLDDMIRTQSEYWLTSRNARHVNPLKKNEVSAGYLARGVVEMTARRKTKHKNVGEMIRPAHEIISPAVWQRATRPQEWLVGNGLCIDENQVDKAIKKKWKYPDLLLESRNLWSELTLATLEEVFARQLRMPWIGFSSLRASHKAICAIMCLFYDYQVDEGNELLGDLGGLNDSVKSKPGAMDNAIHNEQGLMARIDGILESDAGEQMLEIADRHAWVESAFPAMLTIARKDRGVLPASAFLWLKGEDRGLWYILNNVGSEAIMVEAAGAMAHYRAECQIQKPIYRPAVYQAARALLEDYLDMTKDRIAVRKEKEERGRTAGQSIDILLKEERDRIEQKEREELSKDYLLNRKATEADREMEEPIEEEWGDDEEQRMNEILKKRDPLFQ